MTEYITNFRVTTRYYYIGGYGMLFNSYEFMLFFLPIAVIGYFILQKFNQNIKYVSLLMIWKLLPKLKTV